MALFVDYPVADGQERMTRWFDDIDTATHRRYAAAGPIGGWPDVAVVEDYAEQTPAMINTRRDCIEKLILSGTFYNPSTGSAWSSVSECFVWVRANAAGAGTYFVDVGGGTYNWTNVPTGYTDPVGGEGPVGGGDVAGGYEPYGRWWNEMYVVLHYALTRLFVEARGMGTDANGNRGVYLYEIRQAEATADLVEQAYADSVASAENVATTADNWVAGGPSFPHCSKSGGVYSLTDDHGSYYEVIRHFQMYDMPTYTEARTAAKLVARINSWVPPYTMDDWTAHVKVSGVDPKPFDAGTHWAWAAADELLAGGGHLVSGYHINAVVVIDCDNSVVPGSGVTAYTQARGFEIKPAALGDGSWWDATPRPWYGSIEPLGMILEVDYD